MKYDSEIKIRLTTEERREIDEYLETHKMSMAALAKYVLLEFIRNNKVIEANCYRGITYRNISELATKLGKSRGACRVWLKNNPTKTEKDYIDFVLAQKY